MPQLVCIRNHTGRVESLAFKGGVKQEAAGADYQVSQEGNQEDLIMSIAATADNTPDTQPHKHEIRQGIDDLGSVGSRIVILKPGQSPAQGINNTSTIQNIPLHTS